MRRVIALAALALAASAAPAAAGTTLVRTDGTRIGGPWQRWVDRSFVPTPNVTLTIAFDDPAGSGKTAYYDSYDPAHVLHVPQPWWLDRQMLLHEVGHLYDYTCLNVADRGFLASALGRADEEWRSRFASPHEQFAEAYSLVATYRRWPPGGPDNSSIGYDLEMTPRRFWRLRTLLTFIPVAHAARGDGPPPTAASC